MTRFGDDVAYRIAVPDLPKYERQLRKVPAQVRQRLNICLFLVSSDGVRTIEPEGEATI